MSIYTPLFRRFTLRLDSFASVHVGADVGELVTKPLKFAGKELVINYSTSAGGSVRVELQDAAGKAIPVFMLAECRNLVGDAIEQPVAWTKGSDVSTHIGQPVRLRIVMQEADLFALQFRPGQQCLSHASRPMNRLIALVISEPSTGTVAGLNSS